MILDNKRTGSVGDELKQYIKFDSKLSIISGYFTLYGFKELQKELNKINSVDFLLTNSSIKKLTKLISGELEEIKHKNSLQQQKIAKEFYIWLKEKSEIKHLDPSTNLGFSIYSIQNKDNNNLGIQGNSNFSLV